MELPSSSLLRCCLAAVSLTVAATAARAQTASTWTGGSGNWGNAALWSNGVPNSTGADAFIDGGKTGTASSVTLESSRSVGRVTIDAGDALTISEGIALNVYNGAFTGSGSVVNNGSVNLVGSGGGFPTLQFYGAGTISGTGTMTLGGVNARIITATAGDRITIGAGQTVGGQGNLGGGAATFTNNGTVTANQNGAVLALRPGSGTGDFTNGTTGVARAENGGTLQLVGGSAGGNFAGGTFAALAGSTVQINTTTVSNAILSTTGTGAINIVGPSTLSNVTNNGTLSTDGITTTLAGTFGGTGTFNAGGTGGTATVVNLSGPVTLAGGTINLNNANSILQAATTGDRLTVGAGAKITGQGNLGNGTTTITNNGYIIVNAGTLNIQPGGGTADFTNGLTTGTNAAYVTANDGTTVHLNGANGTFTNTANGYFTVESDGAATAFNIDAGKLTNFSGTTLSGGHYNVIGQTAGIATMSLGGGSITTLSNGATVSLLGGNSVFTEINALATNNGTFQTGNGRNFTTVGNLLNTGNLDIEVNCALNVNGTLTFTTVVSPNTSPQSTLFLFGGTITATGAITMDRSSLFVAGGSITAPSLTLAGTIQPFVAASGARQLTLVGTVALQSTTHLVFTLATPGTFSEKLVVQGNFTLGGTLDVSTNTGFGAGRYELIDYSGGTFTNNGLTFGTLPGGYNYALDYSTAGQVNLVVTNAVPEPATNAMLLAAGSLLMAACLRRRRATRRAV